MSTSTSTIIITTYTITTIITIITNDNHNDITITFILLTFLSQSPFLCHSRSAQEAILVH